MKSIREPKQEKKGNMVFDSFALTLTVLAFLKKQPPKLKLA